MPLAERVEVGLVVHKTDGTPLVEPVAVASEARPAVAAVDDRLLFCSAHGVEEARLRDVAIVGVGTRHLLHAVGGGIGAVDARSLKIIDVGGIPSVEVAGAHVVLILIFEHTVALTARTLIDFVTVLQPYLAVGTDTDLRQIDARAALSVAVTQVRLARVGVSKHGLVAGVRRANHAGHVDLVVLGVAAVRRVTSKHSHIVIELYQQRILLGFLNVCNPETPHPVGPASRRRR